MLIIQVMGGLGNQMQQYALYWKLKSLGRNVKLDVSWFEDEKKQTEVLAARQLELTEFVNLPLEICTKEEKESLLGKDNVFGKLKRKLSKGNSFFCESEMFHPEVFELRDAYLSGFWACERYYADVLPELRSLFIFPELGKCQNSQIIKGMEQENSVSMHIRRGDYLDKENQAMFGGICTDDYYAAAAAYVEERLSDVHFYIFSDDPAFAKKRYGGSKYTIVDWNTGEDSFRDMQLMSCCKHNICANSTFSFWGARLNPHVDKIMIRPAKHKNSQPVITDQLHDLWKNWIIIGEKGNII